MQAIRNLVTFTLGVLLLFAFSACEREITRIEQVAQTPLTCFECHSDDETFLVSAEAQWANSMHASGHNIDRNYSPCSGCHTSEGFKLRVAGESPGSVTNPTAIHCFTCHAPHTDGNFNLRVTAAQELQDGTSVDIGGGNICIMCHQSRRDVNTYVADKVELSEHWGPHHGPQGDMYFASNGYEYEGYDYEPFIFHLSLADDGCLDCHFKSTSNYVVGGHSFNMLAMGAEEPIYNVGGCNVCHLTFEDFSYKTIQDSVATMAAVLEGLLEDAGLWGDGEPLEVETSADSAGAVWNYLFVEEDRSEGIHNSKYALGLLESAIMYLQGDLPQDTAEPEPLTLLPEVTRR
jgi:hypothetical protein